LPVGQFNNAWIYAIGVVGGIQSVLSVAVAAAIASWVYAAVSGRMVAQASATHVE
jgi:hypothetical protein